MQCLRCFYCGVGMLLQSSQRYICLSLQPHHCGVGMLLQSSQRYICLSLQSRHCYVGILLQFIISEIGLIITPVTALWCWCVISCHNIVMMVCFYSCLKDMAAFLFIHNIVMLIYYYSHLIFLQSQHCDVGMLLHSAHISPVTTL